MPDLSGRPLRASALDTGLFVDREHELAILERSAKVRLNTLLVGRRGAGKTSLLHHLEHRLAEDDALEPVFVEGGRRAEQPEELLSLVAYRLDPERARLSALAESGQAVRHRRPGTATERLLSILRTIHGAIVERARRPVLIVDELPVGDVPYVLFGQLRDELWSIPATWIVATEVGDQAGFVRPPANAFFETVVTLTPLTHGATIELLRRRTADVAAPESLLADVAAAGCGNPRRVISLARDALVGGHSVDELAGARAVARERASELGEAAARLYGYLEANGAASASDERMLKDLGWTRSRATQVLRRLQEAGLVEVTAERGASGRRKLYALGGTRDAP